MTGNPLLKILPYLTRKEMTRFREFAHSPYFNKHKNVRSLVDLLSANYPVFNEKKFDRKALFPALFPGQKHQQPKLALVFTYTFRLLEQFIQIEESGKDGEFDCPHRMLRFLRQRNISFLYEKKWKENFNGVKKNNKPKSPASIAWAAEMDAGALLFGNHGADFLSLKQDFIDTYYLREKLSSACEMVLRSRLLKRAFTDSPLLQVACDEIENNLLAHAAQDPSIPVYLKCFRLLSKNDPSLYADVAKTVEEQASQLPDNSLQNIYNYLQNFCITQINQGNKPYLRRLFDIYRSQLERSLLLVDGQFPEWHYKNIVTTGLRLEEHHWVRQFLEEYRELLPPDAAENAYSYNLANYHYHLRHFDEVLQLLVQVEYTDLRYQLDAKSMLLRTYFDLAEEEPLMALCDAFRQMLKRNHSLSEFQKKGYINMMKFTRKLFRLKMSKGLVNAKKWETEKEKLGMKIMKADTVFNLKWLEEKMKEV